MSDRQQHRATASEAWANLTLHDNPEELQRHGWRGTLGDPRPPAKRRMLPRVVRFMRTNALTLFTLACGIAAALIL